MMVAICHAGRCRPSEGVLSLVVLPWIQPLSQSEWIRCPNFLFPYLCCNELCLVNYSMSGEWKPYWALHSLALPWPRWLSPGKSLIPYTMLIVSVRSFYDFRFCLLFFVIQVGGVHRRVCFCPYQYLIDRYLPRVRRGSIIVIEDVKLIHYHNIQGGR
jgi:hypothetical protein